VEEVAAKIMKIDKVAELFQTMAIMSLNMGNLTLEVNILKNRRRRYWLWGRRRR